MKADTVTHGYRLLLPVMVPLLAGFCNGLLANIGLAQVRSDNATEMPLLTSGDDLLGVLNVLAPGKSSYTSSDVIDYLTSGKE